MKISVKFFLGGLAVILLLIGLWLHLTQTLQKPVSQLRAVVEKSTSQEVVAIPAPELKSETETTIETESALLPISSPKLRQDASEFERFNDWISRYLAATEEQRKGLIEEGMHIAQERRVALSKLIETDPRRAIENAVPPVLRQQLPLAVAKLLEERVNETGFYGVFGALPSAEYPKTPPYRREVRTSDGGQYRAFVYGSRLKQKTTENASIVGIAVDDMMAIDERPLRTVASGEIPNHPNNLTRNRTVRLLNEQGFVSGREVITTPAPPRDIVEICPVSGEATEPTKTEDIVAVAANEVVVEAKGQFHYLCRGGHIVEFEEQLIAGEGGNGGPVLPTSPPAGTQSIGYKTHLMMRIAFPEAIKGSVTEYEAHDLGKRVQDWFTDNSYGAMTFMTTVTPLLIMPRSEAWYKSQDTGGADEVLIDSRALAKAAGFDPANFNFDTVIYTGTPGSFGGQAYVGGKGCWLKSGTTLGTACHEYGHNFGLWHANFWDTTNGSSIGGGSHVEYGDSFDTMGASSSNGEFNAYEKNLLNWLPNPLVHDVTTNGTYRIYQTDQPAQNPRLRYALKTRKDADRDYWVDFRQDFPSNAWVQGGVFLHWSPWATSGSGSHLLDATPGSIDLKNDATVVIGRTFSDLETGIHITPIAKNATEPPSVDVVVNLGMFPGNSAPVVAVGASATSAATNAAIDFTATASDLDGDVLSYAWDFGDKSFSTTNSPTVSKSWATAGEYRVRCTVSDMKGKTASASVIVTIGTTSTFRISGTITSGGQPLANVRVHNSLTGTSYREAYTDADGTYTLTRLATGTYTVGTQLYGYTLTPTGSASVAVGPNKTLDFTAAAQSVVSIAVQDADCAEGANTGSFRISRTGSTAAALTVLISTPQGSATKNTDYTQAPAFTFVSPFDNLTIPAGQAYVDVVVTATDDTGVESFESAILTLVPSTNYVIGNAAATIWIADADTANPLVRLSVADRDADESGIGGDGGQFVIERLGSTTAALTVSVALSGTATNGTDYASIPTTVTIPAGASSVPVNVTPLQDTAVEVLETVILTISTNAAYTRVASSAEYIGTVNLHDDDQPILTVVATDSAASEASNDPGVFTVTRTGSTAAALTVNYGITGSALHGTDYEPLPGVLTIPAGSAVGTIVITPIDDAIGEPDQTAVLQLRGGTAYTISSVSSATVTIADNDLPYASIAVTTGPAIEGSTAGVFRVTTTGTGTGNITVLYTVTGTATNGTDFTTLSGSLSIAKNTTATFNVATIQDTFVEGYETVTVTLTPDPTYTLALDSSATMNLQDDDAPQVNVSNTDDAFTETNGSLAKFYVSRTGATTSALTVNYTLGGTATSGSDYTAPSGSVTIAAAAAGAFVDISMLDDTLAEGTESIVFNVTPGAPAYSIGIGSATHYITDAEAASVVRQVRFSAASSSAAENAGTVNIPVTLDAAAASDITVEYFINGGTALSSGIDYVLSSGVLTFAAGVTSQNIQVVLSNDTLDESSETLVVAIKNPGNAKLGTSSHTLTITDDDTPPAVTVGFAGTTGSGLESQSGALLTVALSKAQGSAVTVDYATTGGTATGGGSDYTITNGTLTFAAGETVKVIPNSIVDDASAESNETIILTLSSPVGAALNANSVMTYTITDDDAASITIVATDANAAEPGTDTGLFTVTRTGPTTAALTVNFSVSGTATSGADYAYIASTAVIPAGASSATVLVTPLDDKVLESAETVMLNLTTGLYTIGAQNSATVSITDNESDVLVSIIASDAVAAELGNPGAFTVTRTGSTASALTVNLSVGGTATSGSDYTALATSVVIPAASSSVVIPVSPLTDALNEGDESVVLIVLGSVEYSPGSPVSATVIISNTDDGSPPTLVGSDIVDNKGGASVFIDTLVTYTVTFSKDMDASTVTASDFSNAGTAAVTIGSVSETTPISGVFTVEVMPTGAGTLQLRVNAGAVLKSVSGTNLSTASAIVDNTTITVSGTSPLATALDTTGLTWTTSGNLPWFNQTITKNDGVDAAQSGAIGFSQVSSMETTLAGPGTLTFWWKVSSEPGYDWLTFYMDNVEQTGSLAKIAGEVVWVQKTVSIPAGSHVVRWSYSTDSSIAAGSDAAWVDQVVYTPSSQPEIEVEQPLNTGLVDGASTIDFGSVNTGSSTPLTFTIKNVGTADLTGILASVSGVNSADYTFVNPLPAATLAAGASTTCTVRFTPGASGVRAAVLQIASDDANENPFDINLTGTGVGAGSLAVTPAGNFAPSGNFGGPFATTQVYTLSNPGNSSINWTATNVASWVTLSATGGTLAAGANTTVTVSINSGANTLNVGSYSDTVTFTNSTNGTGNTTRGVALTVNPAPATVTLGNLAQTYNGAQKTVSVTTNPASLANSVTYNGSVTAPTNAGTYAVVATITNSNYTGSASNNLVIAKAPQTITFNALSPVLDDAAPFALSASASSGLTVAYSSSNTSVATVSGNTVTIVGIGSTTITASQAGNTNVDVAPSVGQTLTVNRSNPLAVPGGPYKVIVGQSLSLNGSASEASYGNVITSYAWDLNNDNNFTDATGVTPAAITSATLISTWGMTTSGANTIKLRVTDSAAKTSTLTTTVELINALTWDSNAATSGQTNGGGAWLNASQWWDGTTNLTWTSGANAGFGGPNTAGGAVTLASPTSVGSLTFNAFTGTYTLGTAAQAMTINGGINKTAASGAVTFLSPMVLGAPQSWVNNSTGVLNISATLDNAGHLISFDGSGTTSFAGGVNNVISGAGGITMNGSGRLQLGSGIVPLHTYSGTTTLNAGVTMIANNNLGTGNLTLNGGAIETYWNTNFTRALGAGVGEMQIIGGASGFGVNGSTSASVIIGNSAVIEAVWGSAYFNPSTLVLQTPYSQGASSINFQNTIDLNGATRTIQVSGGLAGTASATLSGVIRNSTGTAGIIKTGSGWLYVTGANTYNGSTTVSEGMVDLAAIALSGFGGGSGRNISIAAGAGIRRNALDNAFLNRLVETTDEITLMTGATANNLNFSGSAGANLPNAFLGNYASNGAKCEYTGTITPAADNYRLGGKGSSGLLGIVGTNKLTGARGLLVGTTTGGGRVELAGANDFTGNTVIRTGARLTLSNNLALQNSALDLGSAGGTFSLSDGLNVARITGGVAAPNPTFGGLIGSRSLLSAFSAASGGNNESVLAATAVTGFILNPGNGVVCNYSGAIAEFATATTLTKSGLGAQILSGAHTYTGATNINQGALFINGSLSNVAAALNVASGATLGGNGTIGRNVTIADGGKLEFDISTNAASHNPLDISTGRDFGFTSSSVLTITTAGGASAGTYTLVTGGNNIGGLAPATINLPVGWAATVSISGNSLLLTVTSTTGGAGSLAVTGAGGLSSSGYAGGSFAPNSISYTLTNPGQAPINWTAGKTAAWLDLSAVSGTLAAGANTTVTVTINATANSLAAGSYGDTVTFSNATNATGDTTRSVALTVNPLGTYIVSYNGNGNTGGTAPINQTKVQNVNLTLSGPGNLARTGYTFNNWNTAAGGSGTPYAAGANYTLNVALSLFAQWTANTYTVAFDANGGDVPSFTSKSVTYGSAYGSLATVARTGYTFNGWFTAPSGGTQVLDSTTVSTAGNQTLYAQWTASNYTVTFNSNGGDAPSPGSKVVSFGSAYGALATVTRTGYDFNGWFTATSGGTEVMEGSLVTTSSSHILYAQWTVKTYMVSYDANNASSGTVPLDQTKTHDVNLILQSNSGSLIRTGYTFNGWNTATDGSGTTYNEGALYTGNVDLALFAKWTANTYTVTFDANGGTPTPPNATVTFGSVYGTLATPTRLGYTFNGWFTAASGGTLVTSGGMVTSTSNHTLYAQWTLSSAEINITALGFPDSPIEVGSYESVSNLTAGVETKRTYVIKNDGNANLTLANAVISSASNCSAIIASLDQPAASVIPAATTSLTVAVIPTAAGAWSFTVSMVNNDPNENPYQWTIYGVAESSTSLILTAVSDTYIDAANIGVNYGTTTSFSIFNRTQGQSSAHRYGLIKFNLSTIPTNATVTSASLNLVQSNAITGAVDIYDVTGNWVESGTGGATWSNSNALFGASIGTAPAPGVPNVSVPSIGLNLPKVQSWVTTPGGYFGLGVKTTNSGKNTEINLHSREATTAAYHPKLNIAYSVNPQVAEMHVTRAGSAMLDEGTDALSGTVAGAGTQLAYSIVNLGNANLTLTTPVAAAVSNCTISVVSPVSPVSASADTPLLVTVTPTTPGTWSATVSIANNDPNEPTYNWTLTGTATGSYTVWANGGSFANTLGNQNMAVDFDNDGLATGLEWVVGGDPTLASDSVSKKPVFDNTTDSNYFIYSYRRADIANTDPKTSIIVQYGSDLTGWTDAVDATVNVNNNGNIEITETNDGYGAGVDKVDVKIKRTLGVGSKLFSRLKVNINP